MGTSLPGGTWGSSPRGRRVSDALSLVTHLGSPEQGAGPTRACRFSLDLKRPHALGACPHRALPRGCSLVPVQDGRPRHQGRCCDTASRARPPAVRVTARGGAAALLASPSGAPRQGTECACSDGGARPTWGISRSRSVALPPWAQAAAPTRPRARGTLGLPASPRGTRVPAGDGVPASGRVCPASGRAAGALLLQAPLSGPNVPCSCHVLFLLLFPSESRSPQASAVVILLEVSDPWGRGDDQRLVGGGHAGL